MSKFSNIGEQIKYGSLVIEDKTLTSDDLDELFKNDDVKKVSTISMIKCNISTIPESIINLKPKLRHLYLSHNNISELPINLGEMKLFSLYLTGNPVNVNKRNIHILDNIYNKEISNSNRVNKARPRIFFDTENRNNDEKNKNDSSVPVPVSVIGDLDLVSERSYNKGVLSKEDFDKLYSQIGESPPKSVEKTVKKVAKNTSVQRTTRNKKARNTKEQKLSSESDSESSGYEPSSSESSASSKLSYASSSSSSSRKKRATKKSTRLLKKAPSK